MKILHICTQDHGGAGKAALRAHLGLKSIGVDSKMLVLYKHSSHLDLVKLIENDNPIRKLWVKVRRRFIPWKYNNYIKTSGKALDIFTNDKSIYDVSNHHLIKEADIINLHWVAELINYTKFFPNIKNNPKVVWTLHDENPFTGGCHVVGECTKYQTGCGSCPQLGSKDTDDPSRRIFKTKEKAYKGKNMYIVTPSKWLRNCAKESLLFKNFQIDVIPNGIPHDIFRKHDKKFSRRLLNLPQDKVLILFGAYEINERKGFKYLLEALKLLKKRIDPSKLALVTFGPKQEVGTLHKDTGFAIYQLGYIKDETLLSTVYSSVDMSIMNSLYENFPNIILESFSCSTPVIGVYSGSIPDTVTPHKTGLLAELKNTKDLVDKIEYMITHPKEREEMGENARKLVEQEYTLQIQAKCYLKLYEMILSASRAAPCVTR